METTYSRRVGREEAQLGRVAILKSDLRVFPAVGTPFTVQSDKGERELRVESYACECRGPARPHEHWFLRWPGAREGDTITFKREGDSSFTVTVTG